MTRNDLVSLIQRHTPFDAAEAEFCARTIDLIQTVPDCFYRHEMKGHITTGVLILSPDLGHALLHQHKIFGWWMHFGGHADGNTDLRTEALRETLEESGLHDLTAIDSDLFDMDVHGIVANPNKNEPAHNHHDLVFLTQAKTTDVPPITPEGQPMRWVAFDDFLQEAAPKSAYPRWHKKWAALRQRHNAIQK